MKLRKNSTGLWISSLCCVLPIAVGVAIYDRLPAQIATHFDMVGNPNGWSSRPVAVFGIPLFLLAIHLIGLLSTKKSVKETKLPKAMQWMILWICPLCSWICSLAILTYALEIPLATQMTLPYFFGILLLLVGYGLPKTKQNQTVGIKLPWTLADEANWDATHRFAGRVWTLCGVVAIALSLLHLWGNTVFIVLLTLLLLLPTLYSFRFSRKTR